MVGFHFGVFIQGSSFSYVFYPPAASKWRENKKSDGTKPNFPLFSMSVIFYSTKPMVFAGLND
jgi:hypothetical protein